MYAVGDDWVAGFAVGRSARGLPEDPPAWIAGIARRNGPLANAVAEAEVETPYIDRVAQSVVPRWRLGGALLMSMPPTPSRSSRGRGLPSRSPGRSRSGMRSTRQRVSTRARGLRVDMARPGRAGAVERATFRADLHPHLGAGAAAAAARPQGGRAADRLQVRREALRWRADPLRYHEGRILSHTVGASP